MKNSIKILSLLAIITVSSLLIFSVNKDNKVANEEKNTSEYYQIRALKLPKNLNFAGEAVPVKQEDIRERMDRELLVNTYWQSNGLILIKRAHKYFPIIEPILKKNGIPDDFKYLAVIESGLDNVTSPAGARGFWQIMPATAKESGLEVNDNVDERYNLEKATQAACDYLNKAYKKFGNWTLTAASYNAGMSGISRRLDSQFVDNYYDLLLADETERYLLRIVAVKEILNNPKSYGFIFDNEDLYVLEPTKTIKVDTVITDIALFSKNLGINYKIMKIHNPWLRENKLNNSSRKLYEIKIPLD
ncbi:lytic transglycosylase domain-containing protein [Lutibacter sp. HS1-25]|uniref:lytic transglycosylase domain-containing protein n=1 Tax=Lutibacter sp. HS1-25 TaxID=2485000 RepID=UPI001013A0C1|nr:lytic transglycosylase domain-containing protein [Lutibacter sp. HS1-25]RXP53222.1 lytic transglycosylase domain-containing protein [Lutibacter sp. HS1-25]